MKKIYFIIPIIIINFLHIATAQTVDNLEGTWLPRKENIASDKTISTINAFLKNIQGSIRPMVCQYDGLVVKNMLPFKNGVVQTNTSNWQCEIEKKAVAGKPYALDLVLHYTVKSGSENAAGVAVSFDFSNWSAQNHVMVPSAMYNGNRFKIVEGDYPIDFEPNDNPLDPTVVVGNIIRLGDGKNRAKAEFLTGSCSTPMMSFYDAKAKRGFIMLTQQQTRFGNSGLIIEENPETKQASFVLSAPGVREKRYVMLNFVKSPDKAANWKAGDTLNLPLRIYQFPAKTLLDFYLVASDIRKDLSGESVYRTINPFSYVTDLIQTHHDNNKWYEDKEIGYLSSYPTTNIKPGHLIAGYTFIWAYPYAIQPNDERIRRIGRTFDAFKSIQGASGFMNNFRMRDQIFGPVTPIRRAGGEGLYFGVQTMDLLKKQGYAGSLKPAWDTMLVKIADGLVKVWNDNGDFGQQINVETGKIVHGGSSGGVVCAASLVIASKYFNNPTYLAVAEKAEKFYYDRDLSKGYVGGTTSDALMTPDSEGSHNFVDLYALLYEATGKTEYLKKAKEAFAYLSTWEVSYNYKFPKGSTLERIGADVTGSICANVQNKHSAPCFYIHSGDFLLKLYRATGDKRYAELLKDICHNVQQYANTPTNKVIPPYKLGAMTERVQIGDWEGALGEGYDFNDSKISWETGALLSMLQNPGIYLRTDKDDFVVFDHVDAEVLKRDTNGLLLLVTNTTKNPASVSILAENEEQSKKPLGYNSFINWQKIELKAGETAVYAVSNSGVINRK
jgi:hypothetical protein